MRIKLNVYSVFSAGLLVFSAMSLTAGLLSAGLSNSLVIEWEVWSLSSCLLSMSLVFDWMSLIFLGSVCLISGCVMKYSEYYMEGEINFFRFVFILFMFVSSMWLLIISPNLISLLLGWDGLGLTSYALVIFYQNESSCNAGMLTVLSNRIGDVAILLSIALMFSLGSWDFYKGLSLEDSWLPGLIILASATKSAQMPFSAWLPAAMAAPTPVSALVHSSTLVTAGVYLLIRFSEVIEASGLGKYLLVISVLTMVMAGLGAMFESDMKKVVALSTLSQLGLMVMILSTGMKELAFFHLITHAMFKSTLFMCVGFMLHSVGGSQDSRVMSGFSISSPAMGVVFGAMNLALCGFPFLAGFYSKDAALEYMLMSSQNLVGLCLIIGGTGLTVAYSFRVMYLGCRQVSSMESVSSASDMDLVMMKSLSVLFLAALVSGFFLYWAAIPVVSPSYLSDWEKMFVVLVSVLGGVLSYMFLQKSSMPKLMGVKLAEMMASGMWFMPFLSTKFPSAGAVGSGFYGMKFMDLGWFEYYGGQGGRQGFMAASSVLQKGQSSVMVSSFMLTTLMAIGFVYLFL
uniref:NADH-ubiquinone oxidoreductase chain 5 n=1 Tax=Gammarus lacustris TaxID=52639 RepID=A0A8E8GSR7_9CRUS|nr:NADH dehydrogenase subunit 5 [Gammarus lacustris]